jgi:hypothetical protein
MAVPVTQINGKVVTPLGVGATAGRVELSLSQPGTVLDPATGQYQRIGGALTSSIGSDGAVSFSVVPNDIIEADAAGGSYYRIVHEVTAPVRARWEVKARVPSSGSPVNIGSLIAIDPADADLVAAPVARTVTIERPASGEKFVLARLDWPATVQRVAVALSQRSAGASVVFNVAHGTTFPLGTLLWSANKTCNDAPAGVVFNPPFDNGDVALNSFLELRIVTVSGTVDALTCTIYYRTE